MAEEEDPWAFDDNDTAATETAPPPAEAGGDAGAAPGAPAAEGGEAAAAEAGEGEGGADTRPVVEDDGYRKPVQLYRHWVRPQFLQYNYMYNYRTNYYDDVIDFLDKRSKGVKREPPRAQTWAERVLRTQTRKFEDERSMEHDHYAVKTLGLDSSTLPFTYQRSAAQKSLSRSKSMLTMRRSVILGTNP